MTLSGILQKKKGPFVGKGLRNERTRGLSLLNMYIVYMYSPLTVVKFMVVIYYRRYIYIIYTSNNNKERPYNHKVIIITFFVGEGLYLTHPCGNRAHELE